MPEFGTPFPHTKIIIEEEGQPSVTLLIDPAEPPVSLGALLERARKLREEVAVESGQTNVGGYAFTPGARQDSRPISFEVMGGGHIIRAIDSDLEDVLDSYRLAGRLCGVQVFAVDHVVCWIGDIEQAQGYAHLRLRNPVSPSPVFHNTFGANALEDAAKWLREQLG